MSEKIIDIISILDMIPHRFPLLLVDRVIELEPGVSIKGIKNVSINEPHFQGHFPGLPIMPGVLIIEALAQLSGILAAETLHARANEKLIYFMSVEEAKFRKVVSPGDQLILESKVIRHRGEVWKCEAKAFVDQKLACEAIVTFMVKDKESKNNE